MIRILLTVLSCGSQACYTLARLEGVPKGRAVPPSPEELSHFAVEHKNAEQLFNEYTFGWVIERDDVVTDRARVLTSLSRSPYYNELDDSTAMKTGTSRSTLVQLINLFDISQPFKDMLQQALTEGCLYFIDEEFRLLGKTLIYYRIGYMQQSEGNDKYMLFQAQYSVDFTDIQTSTQTFLECAGKFRANDSLCAMPENLSKLDWLVYKIWTRANAITSFMGNYKAKRDQVMNQLRDLIQYLPPTYKPAQRCPLWQPRPVGCDAVANPKFGIVLGLTETLNYTKPTPMDEAKVKLLITYVEVVEPSLKCQISMATGAEEIFADWLAKGHIDQYFRGELANTLSMRTDGAYFVRDLIFNSGEENDTMVNYARIYVHKDKQANDSYNIGGIFATVHAIFNVQVLPPVPCEPNAQYCLIDQVRFAGEDQFLKNYIVYKAVDFLTSTHAFVSGNGTDTNVQVE